MTTLSYAQLEGLWIANGGSKAMAPLMAAIALAESGGNPDSNNYTDSNGQGGTQTSWGLWQISNGTHSQPVPNIDNPAVNAQQAVAKYQSQGLSAWGTYTSGAYKAFMSNSTTPDMSAAGAPAATLDSSTSSPDCAITMPSVDLVVTSVGGGCLVTYSTERALIAGLMMGAAGLLALAGFVILAASAFGSTGAGRAVEAVAPVAAVVGAVSRRKPAPAAAS
jgi:Lysozyme like domain